MPRSLVAQLAVAMAIVLLVAQAVNFMLILNDRQRLTLAQNEAPAVARFVNTAAQLAPLSPEERLRVFEARQRGARFLIGDARGFPDLVFDRDARLEGRVRTAAGEAGLRLGEIRAGIGRSAGPPAPEQRRPPPDAQLMLISAQIAPGTWLHARLLTPRPDPWLAARLAAATLLLYILVLGTMIFLAARIARPLRDLAAAAEGFGGSGATPFVEPRGPSDLAHAIEAFNAMNRRVAALLAEKDHMLGALSHDLRTPLASLRIRAENIEPEEERLKVVGTIEEMTAMLEDSLLLVRAGRTREKVRAVDVGALADVVVEEFRELGHDVTLVSEGRQIASVSPALLRRAIRNLVDNAVKYGGAAEVSVRLEGMQALIDVADRGPGVPADELERVQEPFFRLEESRNRATGGTGLGLTIARAIAEGAGGTLRLANRPGGGLCATIAVPREPAATK
ncbi:MAG TPA: HAMP domain-containing sensor histidine kinase [Allosphingosinicella sp.]|jgi:signal transduction histidine kinase